MISTFASEDPPLGRQGARVSWSKPGRTRAPPEEEHSSQHPSPIDLTLRGRAVTSRLYGTGGRHRREKSLYCSPWRHRPGRARGGRESHVDRCRRKWPTLPHFVCGRLSRSRRASGRTGPKDASRSRLQVSLKERTGAQAEAVDKEACRNGRGIESSPRLSCRGAALS